MKYLPLLFIVTITILISGCKKEEEETPNVPMVNFKFAFDSNQIRLDNFGNAAVIPNGNAGQSPSMIGMSAHYIELITDELVQVGDGEVLFKNEETSAGGALAIDFSKSTVVSEGEVFFSMPLADIPEGSYEYLRVSLAYQNYDVDLYVNGSLFVGTVASFVGYNTYITDLLVKTQTITVDDDVTQGYFAFEVNDPPVPISVVTRYAPVTTVVNPLHATSPIPANSCLVTGTFSSPLTVSHTATEDINITVSLSTNNSFEWRDDNADGKWDVTTTTIEDVVDMGIRGMIPIVE